MPEFPNHLSWPSQKPPFFEQAKGGTHLSQTHNLPAEATYALAGLVATLPDPSGNSPTSRETHPHITLLDNGSSTKATRQMPSGIVRDRMSSLARSSSSLGEHFFPNTVVTIS